MDSSTKQYLAYSLTMMLLALPSLALAQAQASATAPNSTGTETGQAAAASGDDAIHCRPPQQLANSQMKGPKVCMTVGKWNELRAKGLDVSSDGQSLQRMPQFGSGLLGTP